VTIKGIPGIGKSTLAQELAQFFIRRNKFQDGVMFLDIRMCNSIEAVMSCMDLKLANQPKHIKSKLESKSKMMK